MRQSQRSLCAASIAIVLTLSGLGQPSSDGRVSAAPPRQAAGPCIVDVNKVVEPTVLLLGETATVRLQFSRSDEPLKSGSSPELHASRTRNPTCATFQ